MADLNETATQFAKDLISQNIAGLMMAFTPIGMGKAMALQSQLAASGGQGAISGFDIVENGAEGDDRLVDIVMKTADGERALFTRWKDVAGSWKVDDIGVKA